MNGQHLYKRQSDIKQIIENMSIMTSTYTKQ